MKLIPVYVRREPTTDPVAIAHGIKRSETVFYRDRLCNAVFCRKPWYQSGHPRRNTKAVTLNCFRWAVNWVDDVATSGGAK